MRFSIAIFLIAVLSCCHNPATNHTPSSLDSNRYHLISETELAYGKQNDLWRVFKQTAAGNYQFLLRVTPGSGSKEEVEHGSYFLLDLSPNGDSLGRKKLTDRYSSADYIASDGFYYSVSTDFNTMIPEGWVYINKYDKNWNLIWRKEVSKISSPDATAMLRKTRRNELLVVSDEEAFPYKKHSRPGLSVATYTGEAKLITRKFYPLKEYSSTGSVISVSDNNYLISTALYEKNHASLVIIKINPSGDMLWTKTYDSFSPTQTIQLADSSFLFYGNDYSDTSLQMNSFLKILKTDKNGNLVWEKKIHKNYYETPGNMIALSSGNYLFSATIQTVKDKEHYSFIFELDREGNKIYEKTFSVPVDVYRNVPFLIQHNKQVTMISQKTKAKFGDPFDNSILITRLSEK